MFLRWKQAQLNCTRITSYTRSTTRSGLSTIRLGSHASASSAGAQASPSFKMGHDWEESAPKALIQILVKARGRHLGYRLPPSVAAASTTAPAAAAAVGSSSQISSLPHSASGIGKGVPVCPSAVSGSISGSGTGALQLLPELDIPEPLEEAMQPYAHGALA